MAVDSSFWSSKLQRRVTPKLVLRVRVGLIWLMDTYLWRAAENTVSNIRFP
jgi:hypothetical protein